MNKIQQQVSFDEKTHLLANSLPAGVFPTRFTESGEAIPVNADQWIRGVESLFEMTASGALRQQAVQGERVTFVEGQRPLYDARPVGKEDVDRIMAEVSAVNAWNSPRGKEGQAEAMYLPDYPELRSHIIEKMRGSDSLVAIPFAGEKDTIARNATYAIDVMGDPKRVFLGDAGYDPEATKNAQSTGAVVVDQTSILKRCINWGALSAFGLPFEAKNLPRGKSMTMLALYAALAAMREVRPETIVYHHDSDIMYPDPRFLPPDGVRSYDSLATLALPFVFQTKDNPVDAVVGRKHFRDNEHMKIVADRLKVISDKFAALFGFGYASMVQPVSDARAGIWGNGEDTIGFADIPWGTSIAYEDIQVIGMCGASFEKRQKRLAQVAIGGPKIENATSVFQREIALSAHMSDAVDTYIQHISTIHGRKIIENVLTLMPGMPTEAQEDIRLWQMIEARFPKEGYDGLARNISPFLAKIPVDFRPAVEKALHAAQNASLPHRWGVADIASYNARYGGMGYHHDLPGIEEADLNAGTILYNEWLFPGPNRMLKEGIIDLEQVRHILKGE